MKILHISTYDFGGAGLAALNLHKSLLNAGIESKMLVMQKKSDLNSVFTADKSANLVFNYSSCLPIKFVQKIFRKIGFFKTRYETIRDKYSKFINSGIASAYYTFPVSEYDLSQNPLVKEADIVHIHWVANFLDFESFFKNLNKPLVWTFHDINPMYGGFHYQNDIRVLYPLYKDFEDFFYDLKCNSVINYKNLSFVAISNQMEQTMRDSTISKGKNIFRIPIGINCNLFKPVDKLIAKAALNICHKKVFLFISNYLTDPNKGLKIAVDALEKLNVPDLLFICIGNGQLNMSSIISCRRYESMQLSLLPLFYSCADLYINASSQESFGQTVVESLMCGTPVVSFPVGIAPDIINAANGILCHDFTVESLIDSIQAALNVNFNSHIIRQSAIDIFDLPKISNSYIDLYRSLM